MPIALKANYCTKEGVTSAGSKTLERFVAGYDASIVEKLHNAGAIVLEDKTRMDEFGLGSHTRNGIQANTVNPWTAEKHYKTPKEYRSAGGSSGGSAVAVAANYALAAIASDTGGSARLPAAYCGVVGFKPTYGRISRHGLITYVASMDTPSFITKTVQDAKIMLDVCSGKDERDATTLDTEKEEYRKQQQQQQQHDHREKRPIRIGIPRQAVTEELTPELMQAWHEAIEKLRAAGAHVELIELPSMPLALAAYYIIAAAECHSNLARYDGIRYGHTAVDLRTNKEKIDLQQLYKRNRSESFGPEVQRRIVAGAFVLSSEAYSGYMLKAQRIRRKLTEELSAVFLSGIDAILTPTASSESPTFGSLDSKSRDNHALEYLDDYFTVYVNLAGLPAISVPFKVSNSGLPLGMQLVGSWQNDRQLCDIATLL